MRPDFTPGPRRARPPIQPTHREPPSWWSIALLAALFLASACFLTWCSSL